MYKIVAKMNKTFKYCIKLMKTCIKHVKNVYFFDFTEKNWYNISVEG